MRVVPLEAFRDKIPFSVAIAAVERGFRALGRGEAALPDEHGYLTDFRTAAAVALTLKYLAPKDTHEALLVGAGALARLTARAMVAQMPLARLTLWNRNRERAEALAKELGQAVETRIAPALESAVRDHRVIVTATASTTPLVLAP